MNINHTSIYKGSGILQLDNKELPIADLKIDFEKTAIIGTAQFNQDSFKRLENSTEKRFADIALTNIVLSNDEFTLENACLRDIFLSRYNVEADEKGARINLEITPRCSELEFICKNTGKDSSEIYYGDVNCFRRNDPVQIRIGKDLIILNRFNGKTTLFSDTHCKQTFLKQKEIIRHALSVAMGCEVPFLGYYFKYDSLYLLNLVHCCTANGGRLIASMQMREFLQIFCNSVIGDEPHRYDLPLAYYLAGKSSGVHLVVKIISLFTSIEFFDGSRSLDKKKLQKVFNLSSDEASFFKELRNQLTHCRGEATDAIMKACKKVEACDFASKICSMPCTDPREVSKVLYAIKQKLVSILDRFILREIGYKSAFLDCLNAYKEDNLEKILVRDHQIFEKLKDL